ncbi:UBX domain-containing protein [Striga asiatica]|uniref:UBX domain-containing protein n=1 Tax=Striga asiatica TaxID=4170 RepID=A0A5A7PUJ5_STRAF|nr:UBX domain-containing protein [Striga asiatica]
MKEMKKLYGRGYSSGRRRFGGGVKRGGGVKDPDFKFLHGLFRTVTEVGDGDAELGAMGINFKISLAAHFFTPMLFVYGHIVRLKHLVSLDFSIAASYPFPASHDGLWKKVHPIAAFSLDSQAYGSTLFSMVIVNVGMKNSVYDPSKATDIDELFNQARHVGALAASVEHDGTRLVSRFNHHHTIRDVRGFIDASRPGGSTGYQLQTMGFPTKQLADLDQTIEEAGVANSVVTQKI